MSRVKEALAEVALPSHVETGTDEDVEMDSATDVGEVEGSTVSS